MVHDEDDDDRDEKPRGRKDDDDDRDEKPRGRKGDDEYREKKAGKRKGDYDEDDDRPRRRRASSGSGDGGVGYVIPYKNAPALTSYYIGMLCLLLCFVPGLSIISGLAAVVFGFMGMSRASKNPEAHGRAHAIVGIVLGLVQILSGCGAAVILIAMFFGGR